MVAFITHLKLKYMTIIGKRFEERNGSILLKAFVLHMKVDNSI
jgi:hypothetical protein